MLAEASLSERRQQAHDQLKTGGGVGVDLGDIPVRSHPARANCILVAAARPYPRAAGCGQAALLQWSPPAQHDAQSTASSKSSLHWKRMHWHWDARGAVEESWAAAVLPFPPSASPHRPEELGWMHFLVAPQLRMKTEVEVSTRATSAGKDEELSPSS